MIYDSQNRLILRVVFHINFQLSEPTDIISGVVKGKLKRNSSTGLTKLRYTHPRNLIYDTS